MLSVLNFLNMFKVYWRGGHPKPKRQFHDGTFEKRQQARQWCRNHSWLEGLTIVCPDNTEGKYETV
jgi:hypothetical protein